MLDFFISPAHAQEAAAGGGIAQIVMLVGFVLIFYFLLWRPQAKRAKHTQGGISKPYNNGDILHGAMRQPILPSGTDTASIR